MVRLFPRATRRAPACRRAPVAAALTGALLAGLALPALSAMSVGVPSASAADLGSKKGEADRKVEQKARDLDESSAALQAATSALLQARSDLAQAQSRLAQTETELEAARALDARMQERLDAAVARLRAARRDLSEGRREVADQEVRLRQMVVAAYEHGDPALMGLSMVFTTQDPAQLAGNLNASDTVVNAESTALDQLEASRVLLSVKQTERRAAKDDVAAKRKDAADNLVLKESLEQQARDAEQQVAEMVDLRSQARANALEAKTSDLAQLKRLQAERDRIAALIAAQTAQGSGYTGPSDGNGFLDMPVAGPITSPYGWRIHPIWGYRALHDGIDIGAGCGTPIHAPAAGTVLSEYYQSAWGNRIILDHGVNHGVGVSTISNHLDSYAVSVGDRVERGDVIGYVGTTGWSTGCHLHFTVMQNGAPVDPVSWF